MATLSIRKLVGEGYDEFWTCRKFYRMVKGSKGSKKSKTAALWYIYHMMKYPDANTLVVRKVFNTLQATAYTELLWAIDTLQVSDLWKSSVNPLQITYKPTGQVILFRGMDDALKLASITVRKGYLCWVWFEEFYDITDQFEFTKLVMSIRGYIPPESGLFKQITGTFNPWSEHTWIKKMFFDEPRADTLAMTTTYKCNEFMDKVDYDRYEELYVTSPRMARIICDGEWGIAEGLVYDNWVEQEFDPYEVASRPGIKKAFGLDFGYMISMNAFVAVLVDLKTHELWVYDELYQNKMVNLDIARKITEMGYGKEKIIADCAEPKSIAELRGGLIEEVMDDEGNIEYKKWILPGIQQALKGADSITNGIQRLQSFKMYIHPKCTNTIVELNNYCYDKDKDGKLTGKPIKEFDHLMDALRYAMEKFFVRASGQVVEAKGNDHAKVTRRSKRVVATITR